MATSTRSSRQISPGTPTRVTRALVDELRMIIEGYRANQAKSLVADFVVRHRLSHRDVDALLVALAQRDTTEVDSTFVAAPTVDVSAARDLAADEHIAAGSVPFPANRTSAEPFSTAEEAGADTPNGGLAWMFGEEPEAPAPRAPDDVVGQALDDLLGDWARRGGQLTRADVALLATRRKLSAAQHTELLDRLEEAGVDFSDPTEPRPSRATLGGSELQADSVGQYLREISRYPLIDAPREVELWSLISQGRAAQEALEATHEDELAPNVRRRLQEQVVAGRRAHTELVCANLRLVVSIAKARKYESCGVELADRIQDGNLGLMRAADKFDGSKGFKFSTYATWWIRQSIEHGIADRGRLIRIPVHFHEQLLKVRKAKSRLTARLDREPTLAEISDATGIEPGTVQAVLDFMHPVRSLDELLGDDGELRLSDILVSEEERDGRTDPAEIVIHTMFHTDLTRTLRALLPDRSVRVLERRYGLDTGETETLDNIAADYGVTRERIRQIQSRSLAKLRQAKQIAALRSYLIDDSKAGRPGSLVGRKAS